MIYHSADSFLEREWIHRDCWRFQLLNKIIARIGSLLLLVDRIDLCERSPDSVGEQNIVRALSKLTQRYPKTLKVIVTSGGSVNREGQSLLGISLAIINTTRRPHRRYEDTSASRAAIRATLDGRG